MKQLDTSTGRGEIVHSHLEAGRNVLPKEWEKFLCLIPNNRPFLYNEAWTKVSLHTILTSPCFDFEDDFDLDLEKLQLLWQINAFCNLLYTAHKILNEEYTWARVVELEEKASFPQFHKHFALASNTDADKILISASTNVEYRNKINTSWTNAWEISTEKMDETVWTLQRTRDHLLDTESEDVFKAPWINLSQKAQELYTQINNQIALLFNE